MDMGFLPLLTLTLLGSSTQWAFASKTNCPCGWWLADGSGQFTNRLYHDFSQFPAATDITSNPKAKQFTQLWDINNYTLPTDDPTHAHNQQFNSDNVIFSDGYLQLIQPGYSAADAAASNPITIAGIQTKTLDILHGSFRIEFKITGSNGGAVGSFFWYHNDTSEIDIEIVTASNSIVNSTINYTSHPSLYPNGTRIPNATLSVPFDPANYTTLQTHRFDCTPQTATYYLNNIYMHQDHHNVPHYPGSLQLNLWADGNVLWSGTPSTSEVIMWVRGIDVYYNTSETDAGTDSAWFHTCNEAGGPGNQTVCLEGEDVPIASMPSTATAAGSMSGGERASSTGGEWGAASSTAGPVKNNAAAVGPGAKYGIGVEEGEWWVVILVLLQLVASLFLMGCRPWRQVY